MRQPYEKHFKHIEYVQIRGITMPIVNIAILKGRTLDQKKKLVKSVTDAISESIDVSPDKIWIKIDEMDGECFATNGELHLRG